MEIYIADTEKKKTGNDNFIVYNVETKVDEESAGLVIGSYNVWRRFSEFVALRQYLEYAFPAVVMPPMPPKSVVIGKKTHDFVEKRRIRLERFLRRVADHPALRNNEVFSGFLSAPTWTPARPSNSSGRSLVQSRPQQQNQALESVKTEAVEVKSLLASMLRLSEGIKLQEAEASCECDALGALYQEWANQETSDQSKQILEAMSTLAHTQSKNACTKKQTGWVEVEGTLNEYMQLMDSVNTVVRTHAAKQAATERQAANCSSKEQELVALERAGGAAQGIKAVFLKNQTAAQNQQRLEIGRQAVEEAKLKKEELDKDLEKFTALCGHELDVFRRTQTDELKVLLRQWLAFTLATLAKQESMWRTAQSQVSREDQ